MIKHFLFVISILMMPLLIAAQQLNMPMGNDFKTRYYKQLYDTLNNSFTGIQPYIESMVKYDNTYIPPFLTSYSKFEKRLTQKNLITLGNDSVQLTIDPLFSFEKGINFRYASSILRNTRGFWIRGNVGNTFSFETSFLENQIFTAEYLNDYVTTYKVFPGMGRVKQFKEIGYDYAMASGYISYAPTKVLNLQYGHGKLFIGNGYRSLLLSDNSFNFPHFKATFQYKKLQYTWVVASLMNIRNPEVLSPFSEPLFKKKNASFHYLSFKPDARLEFSLFQGIIYNMDVAKYDWNVVNPIILSQAINYGFASNNNVLLGINANAKITHNLLAYTQIMCNDLSANLHSIHNKTGLQLGVYQRDFLKVKNLNLRFEGNVVRPYSYQKLNAKQAYTNYNQSLTHPLNANFSECVFIADYNLKNFIFNVKLVGAIVGTDTNTYNAGNNLFNSTKYYARNTDVNNVLMLRGERRNLFSQDISFGYLINPKNSFTAKVGVFSRTYTGSAKINYYYISLSAFIFNQYLDF
jgi:hypothetical protein